MGLYAVAASQLVFWLIHTVDRSNLDTFFQKRITTRRVTVQELLLHRNSPAAKWLVFQCRNVNIHTIRKRAFPNDSCGNSPAR